MIFSPFKGVFFVQLLAIITFIGFTFFVFSPRYLKLNSDSDRGQRRIKHSFLSPDTVRPFIIFTVAYTILLSQLFIFNTNPTQRPFYETGIILSSTGLILAFIARYQMKGMWNPITEVRIPKKLIDKGIFTHFKHPIYLGRLLFFTGIMLMLNLHLVPLIIPYWYFIKQRALTEETLLSKKLKGYKNYKNKTPRYF